MTEPNRPSGLAEAARPARVVVDTSAIRQVNGDLRRGDWPALFATAARGFASLHLPLVVLQEAVDHRRRDFAELRRLERLAAILRERLYDNEIGVPRGRMSDGTIARSSGGYGRELTELFEDAGSLLPHPTVAHGVLVDRILARRRPFQSGEKGYRDALIWFSVLEFAQDGPVILLTANIRDFTASAKDSVDLHPDLKADLVERGLAEETVTIVTSARDLLRQLLPAETEAELGDAWGVAISAARSIEAMDELFERRLGVPFEEPPAIPGPIWDVGTREVTAVRDVLSLSIVPESGGWYRVTSTLRASGRMGGFTTTWLAGDDDPLPGFITWDDWGGLWEYVARESELDVEIDVTARFLPPSTVEAIDVLASRLPSTRPPTPASKFSRVRRQLKALHLLLVDFADDPRFLELVLGDGAEDLELLVGNALQAWESISDQMPVGFPSLALDNLHSVLSEQAGLSRLREDLGVVLKVLSSELDVDG